MARPVLPGPGEPPLPEWPGAFAEAAGHRLFVRHAGTPGADPAVFVHGLGGVSTNWTDLMALLADRVDGHAPDLPGFGLSDAPAGGRYTLDTHADAVVAYVRTLGGPVHLLGNSLGGAVSIRVAAEHPELVRTLTLVSPALPQYRLRRQNDPRLALLLVPGLSGLVNRERARAGADKIATDVLTLCTYDVSVIHPDRVAAAAEELRRRRHLPHSSTALTASLRGLVRSYFEPGSRNLWRQLGCVVAPTLVVWGDHDRLVPRTLGPVAVRRLRNGRLLRVPDAGHIAQIERPDVVADAVRRLLDDAEGLRASA
ncbi:MAG TPA: alpha/beta fold hydrolase [Mycobacteriales bacterium]|jgi:pimeloyl-ACP methyl ester carboxylesterase